MFRVLFNALLLWAAVAAVGCMPEVPPPVKLNTAGVDPNVDYTALVEILADGVTDDGLLVPDWLSDRETQLDRQLRLLAVTGPSVTPERFPTADSRLAYWYNARAAWSVKLAILGDYASENWTLRQRRRRFTLDGREMSLQEIDRILEDAGDWRILAAAPCATLNRAPLPREPFSADDVRGRIPMRIDTFLDSPKRFVIDVENQTVRVPPVLWMLRESILDEYCRRYGCRREGLTLTTALLPHAGPSATRRLQDAVGYDVVPSRKPGVMALLEEL
ncbi:MAG: hypothetical protein ACLFV7_08665 [Phycisphaerae bacterium]